MTTRDQIVGRFEEIKDLPTFPEAVHQVVARAEDPASSASDIAREMEYEPAVSAAILKVANSAYYNPTGNAVGNIQQAIARLGLREVRNVCLAIGAMQLFLRPSDLVDLREFWRHSIAVALSTRVILRLQGKDRESQNDAFTAGLLHDIGIMVLDQYFHSEYALVRQDGQPPDEKLCQVEEELLGINHGELGGLLLKRWAIPEALCEAVIHHHAPDRCAHQYRRLCQVVNVADFAVAGSGLFEPGENMPQGASEGAWHDLRLDVPEMAVIMEDVRESIECAKTYTSFGLH